MPVFYVIGNSYHEFDHQGEPILTLQLVSYGPDRNKAIPLAANCIYIKKWMSVAGLEARGIPRKKPVEVLADVWRQH